MHKHVPNIITCLNLLTGCIGIYYIAALNIYTASLLVFIAAIFDFADGFSARLLKAYSPVGKSLDSLADLISFGVLPGMLLLKLQVNLMGIGNEQEITGIQDIYQLIVLAAPLFIPLVSAIRLAKFDNDPSQSWEFRGLPTPANAILIAALVWSAPEGIRNMPYIYNHHAFLVINLLLAFLLISPVTFLSLKFKNYKFRDNIARYLAITIMLGSVIFWSIPGLAIGIVGYMMISVISGIVKNVRKPAKTGRSIGE